MSRLPSIVPRAKSSVLLKDVLLQKTQSPPRVTFPRSFNRLWMYLNSTRAPFKSSAFHYDFFNLIPHPFHLSGNYFRLQTRTFIYWYEFSARQFNISFDFGVKQKKIVMEDAIWRRPTRRGHAPLTGWWSYILRFPTYEKKTSTFFNLNNNLRHPVFPETFASDLPWFEEILPLVRRLAWNHYSRLMPYVSNFSLLSQSVFDAKLVYRRAPLDSTTLWLASPVHDYSAFVKSYTNNRSLILPERFFQFRRYRQQLKNIWSQVFGRLWTFALSSPPRACALPLIFNDRLSFYRKIKVVTSILCFPFFYRSVGAVRSLFTTGSLPLPFSWISRVLPVATRARRSKRFVFFLRRFFFLRHLRNRLHKDPKTLSFSFKYTPAVRQLHQLLGQWLQLYAFGEFLAPHWFFWFLHRLLQQRRQIAGAKKIIVAELNADYVRRPRKVWKKKRRR
jgi:hypothetical protein